ncbi:glucose-6-phosphate isomerase [Psychroflexus salis]|uniref:Glucose-6-phosphate isomerase n=1 Tax=Psychroflexus salis TaxID=1526574 RepID=A0A916ZT37_9FLAO|nr:glucose-6-phosphate isomerase [Psychroflexus salis]GGE10240.1 glucose-6-phosphate isomerase [Psychroflexus salis]
MALASINPTKLTAWNKLKSLFEKEKSNTILHHFKNEPNRVDDFSVQFDELLVDFSKHRISKKTLDTLIELAKEAGLQKAIQDYFEGTPINKTEERAVLHTALRNFDKKSNIKIDGKPVYTSVMQTLQQIEKFSDALHHGNWKGYSGKPITDVVNIGIGGSDLGPNMVVDALKYYHTQINTHFVSNVDGDHVLESIKHLNPETTLCLVVSKSFTTQETLNNANTIRSWFLKHTTQDQIHKHFAAVSANVHKANEFGIASENIFPMWDWVGGRFSLWSAAGLSIACAVGFKNFKALLEGAEAMDEHFKTTDFSENIPTIIALIGIWYTNFYEAESEAIIPYTQYLQKLASYLQQASMESNGKSVDRFGKNVNYQTGSIVWGEPGTNSQHAFFQLMHQGTKLIPADFIGFKNSLHGNEKHHDLLMANFFAQTEALLKGKSIEEVTQELKAQGKTQNQILALLPFKVFEGNRPTTTILGKKLSPRSLGMLIAMYEHKIFVQGVIWNIYSYDQWGVELGKQLANAILDDFKTKDYSKHDASTARLLDIYQKS